MFPQKMVRALPAIVVLLFAASLPTLAQKSARRGQFAFVHSMTPAAGGAFTLAIDYAELLAGDAAERAAAEDEQSSAQDGRYIENRTKTLRTLTVPAWAQVYLLQNGQPTLVRPAVLYSLLQGEQSPFGTFYGFPYRCSGEAPHCLAVRLIRRGEQVLRIEQEPLP